MTDWYSLLVWASQLSGYPIPAEPPTVQYKSHEWFVENMCKGREPCTYAGWYRENGVVVLGDWLDAEHHDAFLVHEFSHFLQHKSGKWRSSHCRDNFYREIEAYAAMNKYIQRVQRRLEFYTVPPISCSIDEWDK